MEIRYSLEQELLGTDGGLKRMESFLKQGEFLVRYGDILLDKDLHLMMDFYRSRRAVATRVVHHRRASKSIIKIDEEACVVDPVERPTKDERRKATSLWVNSGIYISSPEFLDAIHPDVKNDIPRDTLQKLIPTGRVYGFPLSGNDGAIDSPERRAPASADIAEGRCISSLTEDKES